MNHPRDWMTGTSYKVSDTASLMQVRQAGLDCIELVLHGQPWDTDYERLAEEFTAIFRQARRAGLEVWSVHLPYGRHWDISATDQETREAVAGHLVKVLQLGESWGVGRAVLHPSYEPIFPEERPLRLEACQASLRELAARTAALNIRIAVECLPRTCLGNTGDEMLELVSVSDDLIVCCDVNHLLQEKPEQFIRKVGSRIGTVHLSDYDGKDEKHWMPGEGIIDWNKVLMELTDQGYQGAFMFEVRNPPPEALKACRDRIVSNFG